MYNNIYKIPFQNPFQSRITTEDSKDGNHNLQVIAQLCKVS